MNRVTKVLVELPNHWAAHGFIEDTIPSWASSELKDRLKSVLKK